MKWVIGLSSLVIIPIAMFLHTLDSYINSVVPHASPRLGNYGVDTPATVLKYGLIFLFCLLLGLQLYASCFTQTKKKMWKFFSFLLVLSSLFISFLAGCQSASMLHASLVSKIRICELLINETQPVWNGTEKVLDVGCGKGLVMLGVAQKILEASQNQKNSTAKSELGYVMGVDTWSVKSNPGTDLLLNAKKEGVESLINYQPADARSLPFENGTFDVVFSSLMVHSIGEFDGSSQAQQERKKALMEMIRVVKSTGRIGIFDIMFGESEYLPFLLEYHEIKSVTIQQLFVYQESWILTATKR